MADPSSPASPALTAGTSSPLIGTTIAGRYKVESLLGSGGMGSVYLVQHAHMRKRFALKLLNADAAQSAEMVARFEREAMATAHIEHPNITAATDFGRAENGNFFLVLEYLEGQRLRDALAAGPLRVNRAVHIARQVASALESSHQHGIIHRDLKPENIMLVTRQGDRDFVKVLDFGFAKVASGMPEPGRGGPADALSKQGTIFGTPRYMAPEQCVGGPVDGRTDLYALGLILYEMLTGTSPFPDADSLKTIRHQISTPTPRMATMAPGLSIPASLEAVVMRLTEKQPEKRYESAAQVLAALAEVAEQEGILPPEPSAQIPASPSRPTPGDKDASGAVQTVASVELVSEKELPATSVRLQVNESQILSERIERKPRGQQPTRPAMAAPTAGAFRPPVNHDQKTAVLPMSLRAANDGSLARRIKARLPASLEHIPLPLLLLAPASLLGLLLALLLRH